MIVLTVCLLALFSMGSGGCYCSAVGDPTHCTLVGETGLVVHDESSARIAFQAFHDTTAAREPSFPLGGAIDWVLDRVGPEESGAGIVGLEGEQFWMAYFHCLPASAECPRALAIDTHGRLWLIVYPPVPSWAGAAAPRMIGRQA